MSVSFFLRRKGQGVHHIALAFPLSSFCGSAVARRGSAQPHTVLAGGASGCPSEQRAVGLCKHFSSKKAMQLFDSTRNYHLSTRVEKPVCNSSVVVRAAWPSGQGFSKRAAGDILSFKGFVDIVGPVLVKFVVKSGAHPAFSTWCRGCGRYERYAGKPRQYIHTCAASEKPENSSP